MTDIFGTWTPTMTDGTNAFTISSHYCYYMKTQLTTGQYFYNCIGKINWSSRTSSLIATRISLPATTVNTTGLRAVGSIGWVQNVDFTNQLSIGTNNNYSYFNLFDLSNTTSSVSSTLTNSSFGATGQIEFSIQFLGSS